MRMASITDKRFELIKRLSRGYKQRVGIAQAIVHNPDVVILDEPTVGLDPNQIKEVRHLIKGLAGEHTIILSTHILPEVEMTCDRVVIINKGRIAAVDTTENLTTQLKGGERVQVKIRASQEAVRNTLGKLEAVKHLELDPSEDSDVVAVTIESEQGTDLRPQIAARVVSSGLELLELRAVKLSLEDIFMQLTTEERAAADADASPGVKESKTPAKDKSLTEVASADA
ncbi:MAG: ATP-binding cassette domain-containing protein, partial [Blastocatellia bacterium]|nr:ATP-binding cassette domain-containing protein [Blastocatellia bacterium]